jgi:hypothetical protein
MGGVELREPLAVRPLYRWLCRLVGKSVSV